MAPEQGGGSEKLDLTTVEKTARAIKNMSFIFIGFQRI